MMVMASGRWSCSPVPSPMAMGTMARTVVALVMRMGRKRSRLASRMASLPVHALAAQAPDRVDLDDGVVDRDAEQGQRSDQGEDVEACHR